MGREHLAAALAAAAAGISVVPPKEDGSKAPETEDGRWKHRQTTPASEAEIRDWYANGRTGVGFVCGAVSGNLELFEFDDMAVYGRFRVDANSAGLRDLTTRIERGYSEKTPGGGIHWFYRCNQVDPNTKLAKRRLESGEVKALIETRGEGGYAVVAPSSGKVHTDGAYELLSGGVDSITTITPEERTSLFWIARSFDEMPEDSQFVEVSTPADADPSSPGNDYKRRGDWRTLLEKHNWAFVYERNGVQYWRRPDKPKGISATVNYGSSDYLYVFSTSTMFEAERGYNKFAVYAMLEHGGDFTTAARTLITQGYGEQDRVPLIFNKRPQAPIVTEAPALPDLDLAPMQPPRWLREYITHATCISPMTPRVFHESAGLWLGSVAIARRLVLRMPFGNVYPNLWVLWLAPTTLYRKTTAMAVARNIAFKVFPHLLSSQNMTTEGIISDMAGIEPSNFKDMPTVEQERWRQERNFAGQRGLILDEMSGLLASAGRDYNAGLLEAFLQFYDCFNTYTRSTRGQGRVTIHNAYLSALGASTPTAMASHLTAEQLWSVGWWPRFALLTAGDEVPEWQEPKEAAEPVELIEGVRALFRQLPEATWPTACEALPVTLSSPASDLWHRYNKTLSYELLREGLEPRLWGTYGRLPSQALKIAIVLAAMEWQGRELPPLHKDYIQMALTITEQWRESAHRALALALRTDTDKVWQRITKQLALAGDEGISTRELGKAMRDVPPTTILDTLQQMVRVGEVEEFQPKREGAGRPTAKYRLVKE